MTESLKNMFKVDFVEVHGGRRAAQEQAFVYFADFLEECEGTDNGPILVA